MLSIQFILNIFKGTKAVQIIFMLLGVSLILIIDLFLTIYLSNIFGEYLIMAIICSISFIGLFFSVRRIKKLIFSINENCGNGVFPGNSFFEISGIFCASIMIFIPGLISTIAGFSLLLPFFSVIGGRYISNKISTDWHTIYEYMKI